MIEIIQEPKENRKEIRKLPKEVRQIGNMNGYGKVYMEDYVYKFFYDLPQEKEEYSAYILLGEDFYEKEEGIFFVKAAFRIENISYANRMPVFSEDVWDEICGKIRRYFPEFKILGWALDRKDVTIKYDRQMEIIAKRHFQGEHQLVLLYDSLESREAVFVWHDGRFIRSDGFFVYMERNGAMQDYLADYHIALQEKQEERRPIENIITTSDFDEGKKTIARYREYIQEQESRPTVGFLRLLTPVAALVVLVLSAVLIQNFMTLHDMEAEVDALSEQKAKEEVLETLNQAAEEDVLGESQTDTQAGTQTDAQNAGETGTQAGTQTDAQNAGETGIQAGTQPGSQNTEQATPQDAASTNTRETSTYLQQGYYVVQKGDKLAEISRTVYGNDSMVAAICEKNGISDMNHICPGDKLLLP